MAELYVADRLSHPPQPNPPPHTSSGGGGLTGPYADPNGNITPDDPTQAAIYYQDGVGAVNNYWRWSVDDQVWYQIGGP